MQENITIGDSKEFLRQKEKYIYDSKRYIEARFLVGHEDTVPISELHGTKVTDEDIARLLCAMKSQIEFLTQNCPEAANIANHMIGQRLSAIQNFKEEEETDDE